jgi:hypothetical protein
MAVRFYDLIGVLSAGVGVELHAAGTATEERVIFKIPVTGRLRKVSLTAGAAITGANTNSSNVNLKHYTGGVGTELANKDYTLAVNTAKATPFDLYAPATPRNMAAGDVLSLELEKVGTGLDLPQLHVQVEYDFHR